MPRQSARKTAELSAIQGRRSLPAMSAGGEMNARRAADRRPEAVRRPEIAGRMSPSPIRTGKRLRAEPDHLSKRPGSSRCDSRKMPKPLPAVTMRKKASMGAGRRAGVIRPGGRKRRCWRPV